jgi:glutamate 5-kinase
VSGALTVDRGAVAALRGGSSLLPAGRGRRRGRVRPRRRRAGQGADGGAVAKGLVAYDAADARRLLGRRTDEIEAALGWRGPRRARAPG